MNNIKALINIVTPILIGLVLIFLIVFFTGCSSLSMNKACKPVEGSNDKFMCKTVMPWEGI